MSGTVIFKPNFVQTGRGPHLHDFAYAVNSEGDTFHTDISVTEEGVVLEAREDMPRFGIYVRWNVEGYGYLYMPADNGGDFYESSDRSTSTFNLNFELANTRVVRNRKRQQTFMKSGWKPSRESQVYLDLAESYLDDAKQNRNDTVRCSKFAQKALQFGLRAADLIELEKARFDVERNGYRPDFLFGCDTRGYFQMDKQLFLEIFEELFNYATITHYLIGDFINFEEQEGQKRFAERDALLQELRKRNITVEGRPLYWVHTWVTPEWLKKKSFPDLLKYLEDHIQTVVGHYGDEIAVWEVVNEVHDWANELELNHEQSVELTKMACAVARDTNSNIRLLVNNCCPFADYVQKGKWHERRAQYPQRTPHQFTKQLVEAQVDFDLIGAQMYFTKRPYCDCVQLLERYEEFGKKLQLAEVGSPSAGITQEFLDKDETPWSAKPYEWTRHWDEELQADWLECIFTYAYSNPYIEAANWYDFVDPYGFLKNGGLLRSPQGEEKAAVERLLKLQSRWKNLRQT